MSIFFRKNTLCFMGQAPISSIQNFCYYVIFVDDCTRYSLLYPLKNKSDFYVCFLKFKKFVEKPI